MTAPEADPYCARICGHSVQPHPGPGRPPDFCTEPECREKAEKRRREQNKQAQIGHRKKLLQNLPEFVRKAYQNAEQFLYRRGLTRRQILIGTAALSCLAALEGKPRARAERYDDDWKQITLLQECIRGGGHDPKEIEMRALAVQHALQGDTAPRSDFEAAQLWIACEGVLADAGAVGSSEKAHHLILRRCETVRQFSERIGDYPNAIKALLTEANSCRVNIHDSSDDYFRATMYCLQRCKDILDEKCRHRDEEVSALLRLETLLWEQRLLAVYAKQANSQAALAAYTEVQAIAGDLDDSAPVLMDVYREACGYFMLRHAQTPSRASSARASYRDQAETALSKAQRVLSRLSAPTIGNQFQLLRVEAEFAIAMGDSDRARGAIETMADRWHEFPAAYYFDMLQRWHKDYGTKIPEYVSDFPGDPTYSIVYIDCFYFDQTLARCLQRR